MVAPPAPDRRRYFRPKDGKDPLAAPIIAPDMAANYPPTPLISDTRDFALGDVLVTHRALVDAGVDTSLHAFEGMIHASSIGRDSSRSVK